jgi:hypothetical protein
VAVFGRRVSETDYGIRIFFKNKSPKEKWYGSDRDKRDHAHNVWFENSKVTAVQDIDRSK